MRAIRFFMPVSVIVVLLLGATARAQTILDIATDATDLLNEDDSEPSIAVNPLNPMEIAIVAFSGEWSIKKNLQARVWKSIDGGAKWTPEPILPSPKKSSKEPGDQKIVYDAKGTLFIVEIGAGLLAPDCFFYRPGPTKLYVPGVAFGDDQPMIESSGSRLFAAWLDVARVRDRSFVARTDDNGVTVTDAPVGPYDFVNRTTRIAVAPSGTVYAILKTRHGSLKKTPKFEKATFWVMKSTDGGVTWNTPGYAIHKGQAVTWFTERWGNKAKGMVAKARSSDAWIATHPSTGVVWAAYCDRDPATGLGQILATHSADGVSWEPPVPVTDGTRNSAYPEIAVASNGTVGVLYVDYDDSGARTVFGHRLARSFDDGKSWSQTKLQEFSTQELQKKPDRPNFLWGDYEGLTAVGETFYGVFTGKSDGRTKIQLDPIFFKMAATP